MKVLVNGGLNTRHSRIHRALLSTCRIKLSRTSSRREQAGPGFAPLATRIGSAMEAVLRQEGIRVAVLRSFVATGKREDWYDRQLKAGVEGVICHPKLVETELDLLAFPTLYFYETGYSLHTLRQASRRSWRIGRRFPVREKFVTYSGTMQETCPRLMGKFSGEGLQPLDTDEDLMSAMARELVEKAGVGESADAVWRDLGHEREKVQPRPATVEPEEAAGQMVFTQACSSTMEPKNGSGREEKKAEVPSPRENILQFAGKMRARSLERDR